MANIKSNEKRYRQALKRNLKNKSIKAEIKTAIKAAVDKPSPETVNHVYKLADQAITKGVYHKNKVARIKSKVASLIVEPKK